MTVDDDYDDGADDDDDDDYYRGLNNYPSIFWGLHIVPIV